MGHGGVSIGVGGSRKFENGSLRVKVQLPLDMVAEAAAARAVDNGVEGGEEGEGGKAESAFSMDDDDEDSGNLATSPLTSSPAFPDALLLPEGRFPLFGERIPSSSSGGGTIVGMRSSGAAAAAFAASVPASLPALVSPTSRACFARVDFLSPLSTRSTSMLTWRSSHS
mmetsp:Transcript_58683/g.115197  ORF Transcript_58683/g.115197 Transcript_58683/m.115197 type:complete len:169 (-) Transcript_58683:636-1142(-)